MNLEDSLDGRLREPGVLAAKVAAVKERTPEVFVNAWVDSFWFHEDDALDRVLVRVRAYVDAGADGVFLPGLSDRGLVEAITWALPVPVNLLAVPGTTPAQLGSWGVRRISSGSLPYRAAIEAAVLAAAAVRDGTPPPPAPSYAAMQERMVAITT